METGDRMGVCFVLMPFGQKADPTGRPPIDFDRIYVEAVESAIRAAGLQPVRVHQEVVGRGILEPVSEQLLLSDFVVVDLTNASANIFYEIGVRHATRPNTTLPIFAKHHHLPFEIAPMLAIPYDTGDQNQFTEEHAAQLRDALSGRLSAMAAKGGDVGSLLLHLLP